MQDVRNVAQVHSSDQRFEQERKIKAEKFQMLATKDGSGGYTSI